MNWFLMAINLNYASPFRRRLLALANLLLNMTWENIVNIKFVPHSFFVKAFLVYDLLVISFYSLLKLSLHDDQDLQSSFELDVDAS